MTHVVETLEIVRPLVSKMTTGLQTAFYLLGCLWLFDGMGFAQQGAQASTSTTRTDWVALLPAGEGRVQVSSYCGLCHTLEPIVSERRADESQWTEIVQKMAYD